MKAARGLLFVLLLTVSLASCAAPPLTVTHEPESVRIVAADSCGPLAQELALAYHKEMPWVTLQVETFDAAVAGERVRDGAFDLAVLSWWDEAADAWTRPFARDAVVIIVNPAVPVTETGLVELREILSGRSGEWSDGTPVQVVSRETGSGLRALLDEFVMAGRDVTLTALVLPDNESMLRVVAETPGAIGYVSLARLEGGVRPLAIEGVPPQADSLGGNWLAYSLLLAAPAEPGGAAGDFVQWVLGEHGQRIVTRRLGPAP